MIWSVAFYNIWHCICKFESAVIDSGHYLVDRPLVVEHTDCSGSPGHPKETDRFDDSATVDTSDRSDIFDTCGRCDDSDRPNIGHKAMPCYTVVARQRTRFLRDAAASSAKFMICKY